MSFIFRSLIAFVLVLTPAFALACTPWSPYDYPIRGAYLVVYLGAVMALSLELFRILVTSEAVRHRLRLAAYTFALIFLVAVIFGCVLRALEHNWRQSLPVLPVGASVERC